MPMCRSTRPLGNNPVVVDRPHVEFVCPEALSAQPMSLPFSAADLSTRVLVGDPAAGNGAALVTLPAGWRSQATASSFELIVLEGALQAQDVLLTRHGYLSAVPGEMPTLHALRPTLAFVDAISDVRETRILPMDEDGWRDTPLPLLTRRPTRGDLGEPCGFFLRVPAGWSMDMTEWHECAEAAIVLDGDLWHVRANNGAGGTMRRHCYFWRPPYELHSPMGSVDGTLLWVYVDGPLVNHFVEVEGGPPTNPTARP